MVAIAVCGIVYELLIASTSSYLLGDSIWQFSITIGLFMSAMGLGSYLSQHFEKNLIETFVFVEILLGAAGGCSVLFLFWAFGSGESDYRFLVYLLTAFLGCLVGFEIPLLLRIFEEGTPLQKNAAFVLTLDYAGGLIGSVCFPLLLLPSLGALKTALLVGLLNVTVAMGGALVFRCSRLLKGFAACSLVALLALLSGAGSAEAALEQRLYRDRVVSDFRTPYQHLVLTRYRDDLRLFIDGNLQFSTLDEYRYHEALVHVPLAFVQKKREALILGGGDGLALREILKYRDFSRITLVDLDPAMTDLARSQPDLVAANKRSLFDSRLKVLNRDAMKFLEDPSGAYSFIAVDLPDPHGESLNKLYTREFYSLIKRHLAPGGVMVVQASSPYFSRKAYWCISDTVASAGFSVRNFHLNVPAFGDWGFVMASKKKIEGKPLFPSVATRYLNRALFPTLFAFGEDEKRLPVEINTVFHPVLLQYYRQGWRNGE